MTATVAHLLRHPIKAVGREEVAETHFAAGSTMPGDRLWAIAHERATEDAVSGAWARCLHFIRGASSPQLMAVSAALSEDGTRVTLTHPGRPEITVDPEADAQKLLDWVTPLVDPDRPTPQAVVRATTRGFTDSSDAGITICNMATHRAVQERVGTPLSIHRWRGNLWLDGLAPWEEFDLVGKRLRVGDAVFEITERTERCRATEANPETGKRDADTLKALRSWGHQDSSVQAMCIAPGRVARGDHAERAA
ncbi:MOSC domain-containing protein [Litorisediminicola beolgyonensis]|uniref:MOSC domain-containing protein n=1 Tax=Litorisediminicola beolgyonensis TaxID=1173614 RepID=A0ABW3ZD28_9RHOB